MAIAPEPYLSACLIVMREAILRARVGHWGHCISHEQAADLMDAVHNLPSVLLAWEQCDVGWLRGRLRDYDQKWEQAGTPSLSELFDGIVSEGRGRA